MGEGGEGRGGEDRELGVKVGERDKYSFRQTGRHREQDGKERVRAN